MGRVLVVQRPESLAPFDPLLGEAWRAELGVETVLVKAGPIEGELRTPRLKRVAGERTETEVVEYGVRWRFDAARVMFAAGNRTERWRVGRLVRSGERVADLFAGIGYFAIPAALPGRASVVWAVEKNPTSVRYLTENVRLNRVDERVVIVPGDNRAVDLPRTCFDRVVLGYLPSAFPWVPRAVELVRASGGWLHLHTVAETRATPPEVAATAAAALEAANAQCLEPPRARVVKPFGPGRNHLVVDARVAPRERST
jgi:tRNA wybutosine-synthesizing protein 2